MSRKCDFSIAHFRWIVDIARDLGYVIDSWEEGALGKVTSPKSLLMRHDVDLSPELAYRFAKLETELDIRSTYFIRLRARFYHPLSSEAYPHLRWIADHGFEIGLHYEPTVYEQLGMDPARELEREKMVLERMLDVPLLGAAPHMPATYGTVGRDVVQKAGFRYEVSDPIGEHARPRWKYLSDSANRWREGCVCNWLGQVDRLAVLIHPVWWIETKEKHVDIIDRLRRGD